MKKIFLKIAALALCGAMGLGIFPACGENEEVPPPDEKPPVDEKPEEEPVDRSDLAYYTALEDYKKTDWGGAKWIWASTTSANSYVAFRKTFSLDEVPEEAVANIAAESKYYLWLNEELAVLDGASKRGATPYDSFYEQVDLTDYLKQGENTLVILVSYNGRGGNSSVDPGKAGLLFQMQAGDQAIVSDSSFKANRLRAYRNQGLLGADWPNYSQSSMLAEWNVYYDARESVGDYTAADFDDSAWEDATVVCEAGAQPFNDTYLSVIPLMKFDEEYTFLESEYIGQKLAQDTTITIDLPENMQFSPYFELTAESSGLRFTYYTNTLTSQGIDSFRDDYVTAEGAQAYESLPWRSGSQLIIEAPAGITFTKIGYRRSGYDSERSGSFVTENEDVNTLWEKAVNTLLICMRGGFPGDPDSAVEVLLAGYTRPMDAGMANDRFFLNVSGFGFDVDVLLNTERYKERFNGMLPYLLGILRTLSHLRRLQVTVTHDGKSETFTSVLVVVGNGQYIGGGMHAVPPADLYDGLFDVLVIRNLCLLRFISLLPRFIKGKHMGHPIVHHFRTAELQIASEPACILNLDGELGSSTPVTFRLLPGAIPMLVPQGG